MITVNEALKLVQEHAQELTPQRVTLSESVGLVISEDVTSKVDTPPFDKSQMDGFAVASRDKSAKRQVIECVAAGDVPHHAVTSATTIRVMTGAPLPDGADSIVPFELVEEFDDNTIRLHQSDVHPGWHVLHAGECVRAGDLIVQKGTVLQPVEIGVLAEISHGIVGVIPQPEINVLPTGNELVPAGKHIQSGQIRNSNGPMLTAAASSCGAVARELGIGGDDQGELTKQISKGLKADVLLLSGGVSAGDFDIVPKALMAYGVQEIFHRIALRPGKPLWFGVYEGDEKRTLVFGLPGNPVSSYVCFELFVRPTIRALAGQGFQGLEVQQSVLSEDYSQSSKRETYLPVRFINKEKHQVAIMPYQSSADLAALLNADGLVRLSAGSIELKAGEVVSVLKM